MSGEVLGVHLGCLCGVRSASKEEVMESVYRVGGVRVDLRGFSASSSILPFAVFLPLSFPIRRACLSRLFCGPVSSRPGRRCGLVVQSRRVKGSTVDGFSGAGLRLEQSGMSFILFLLGFYEAV